MSLCTFHQAFTYLLYRFACDFERLILMSSKQIKLQIENERIDIKSEAKRSEANQRMRKKKKLKIIMKNKKFEWAENFTFAESG